MYKVEQIITPGMGTNCYLFWCTETMEGVVIDPGNGAALILDKIKKLQIKIIMIILTHGHYDHIGALRELRETLQVPAAIHKEDNEMLLDARKNMSCFMGQNVTENAAEILLRDGQELTIGREKLKVLHTPGHTPGGISLWTEGVLFSGDTLFNGSVGRTDFSGGNSDQLLYFIREKLLVLPEETKVYPGHEGSSTIGWEKKYNPFVNGKFQL